jgi:ABC-type polysaccharide/polyol phosphate export permease
MLSHILGSLAFAIAIGGINFLIMHFLSPTAFFSKPFKTTVKFAFNTFVSMAILSFLTIAVTNWNWMVGIHAVMAIVAIGFNFFISAIAAGIAAFVRDIWKR